MTELDEIWSQLIAGAAARARDAGRREIIEYLALKAANDAIRSEAVKWLVDSFMELVSEINRRGHGVAIERTEPHRFSRGNSSMVGSRISARLGVRCLTLEAGWTRTPGDGIMLRGSLAAARLSHFGMKKADADLSLAYAGDLPLWHVDDADGVRRPLRFKDIADHFQLFLGGG